MKTFKDIKELNFNELAFFSGKSTLEAKVFIAKHLDIKEETKSGPKVKITDRINASNYDFTMKSNSRLEGQNRMEYLCDYYNKGTDLQNLRKLSESKTFINALKFTGISSILNDILNREQLLKLQKTWLLHHIFVSRKISEKAFNFSKKHTWVEDYLKLNGAIMEYEINQEVLQ